jgi:hypothetical protein
VMLVTTIVIVEMIRNGHDVDSSDSSDEEYTIQ